MGVFRELPEAEVLKALEGYTDELSGEAKRLETFYRHQTCKHCRGTSFTKETLAKHAFLGDGLVAQAVLRCTACRCLFDPFSSIILEQGEDPPQIVLADELPSRLPRAPDVDDVGDEGSESSDVELIL